MHEIINNLPKRFPVCDEFRITSEERFFLRRTCFIFLRNFFLKTFHTRSDDEWLRNIAELIEMQQGKCHQIKIANFQCVVKNVRTFVEVIKCNCSQHWRELTQPRCPAAHEISALSSKNCSCSFGFCNVTNHAYSGVTCHSRRFATD